jgi:hypothetical protein
MNRTNRRAFLSDIGRGMLAAGLGTSLANDMGFSTAFANEGSAAIPLGEYASLVELMRNTPAEKLQPMLAQMVVQGQCDLKKLIGAGALANAVTFGGCDYVGFHTAMAMLPALEMSRMLADRRQPVGRRLRRQRNVNRRRHGGAVRDRRHRRAVHARGGRDVPLKPGPRTVRRRVRAGAREGGQDYGKKATSHGARGSWQKRWTYGSFPPDLAGKQAPERPREVIFLGTMWEGPKTAFAVAWLGTQAVLVVGAGSRPDGAFGFRMFSESSTIEVHLFRETGDGTRASVDGGEWVAKDEHGVPHRVRRVILGGHKSRKSEDSPRPRTNI